MKYSGHSEPDHPYRSLPQRECGLKLGKRGGTDHSIQTAPSQAGGTDRNHQPDPAAISRDTGKAKRQNNLPKKSPSPKSSPGGCSVLSRIPALIKGPFPPRISPRLLRSLPPKWVPPAGPPLPARYASGRHQWDRSPQTGHSNPGPAAWDCDDGQWR